MGNCSRRASEPGAGLPWILIDESEEPTAESAATHPPVFSNTGTQTQGLPTPVPNLVARRRFQRAVRRVQRLLRVRLIWSHLGSYIRQYASIFDHLQRVNGHLRYDPRGGVRPRGRGRGTYPPS